MFFGPNNRLCLAAFASKRFGSRASRFKYAVATGFVVAVAGFAATGPGSRSLLAQEATWTSFSSIFGQTFEPQPSERAVVVDPRPRHVHRAPHRRLARASRGVAADPALAGNLVPEAARQSMCVRLCDGYVFPVGTYRGHGDNTVHEAICQTTCPGAATALYVMPVGAQTMEDAVAINTGRSYSQLPDAYHYTTVLDDACTCQKAGGAGKRLSLLKDFTLRRGDAVMTAVGVKVFHGRGRFPYKGADFVALAHSRDVKKTDRATFGAIERANLKGDVATPKF